MPDSSYWRENSILKYILYTLGYLAAYILTSTVLAQSAGDNLIVIFMLFVHGWVLAICYLQYEEDELNFYTYYKWPVLDHMWQIILFSIAILAIRLILAYFQAGYKVNFSSFQSIYLLNENRKIFWLSIINIGVTLAMMKAYISIGFFYNLFFMENNKNAAILSILVSSFFFAVLSGDFDPTLFLTNMLIGIILAFEFLKSQAIWVPIYLAILNGILAVILY